MRVGLIGRTKWLMDAAERVLEHGHSIEFIHTAKAAADSSVGADDFERFAKDRGIPFRCDPRITQYSGELDADICLSVNWVTVLRQAFLDQFPHGVLNAHAGDLPRYRGNATLNWAILNGETEACLTVHRMVEKLDAGPIALKRFRPIGQETDMTELSAWLDEVIPESLVEVLDRIADGTQEFVPQDPSVRPLRAYPRKPEDSRISWGSSTEQILRLVRASAPPFSGALTSTESGKQFVIRRARRFVADHDALAMPGQVCFAVNGNPIIATSDGFVEIVECADDVDAKAAILSSLRNRLQ